MAVQTVKAKWSTVRRTVSARWGDNKEDKEGAL